MPRRAPRSRTHFASPQRQGANLANPPSPVLPRTPSPANHFPPPFARSACWTALGRAYEGTGRLEPSIKAYERALELLPEAGGDPVQGADIALRRALCLGRMGMVGEAATELESLHAKYPTWGVGACALGDALYVRALESTGGGAYGKAHAEADSTHTWGACGRGSETRSACASQRGPK